MFTVVVAYLNLENGLRRLITGDMAPSPMVRLLSISDFDMLEI